MQEISEEGKKTHISEAIEKANTGQGICRKGWNGIRIVPTNSDKCCQIFNDHELLSYRWNPKKDDLIADDWTLA